MQRTGRGFPDSLATAEDKQPDRAITYEQIEILFRQV
jgi:hypothetical protein